MATINIVDPQGITREIPLEYAPQALQAGGQFASESDKAKAMLSQRYPRMPEGLMNVMLKGAESPAISSLAEAIEPTSKFIQENVEKTGLPAYGGAVIDEINDMTTGLLNELVLNPASYVSGKDLTINYPRASQLLPEGMQEQLRTAKGAIKSAELVALLPALKQLALKAPDALKKGAQFLKPMSNTEANRLLRQRGIQAQLEGSQKYESILSKAKDLGFEDIGEKGMMQALVGGKHPKAVSQMGLDLDLLKAEKKGAPSLGRAIDKFNKKPSISNAHSLQHELGNYSNKILSSPAATGTEKALAHEANAMKAHLKENMLETLRDNNAGKLAKDYIDAAEYYRKNVIPYRATKPLRDLMKEGDELDALKVLSRKRLGGHPLTQMNEDLLRRLLAQQHKQSIKGMVKGKAPIIAAGIGLGTLGEKLIRRLSED